MRITTGILKGRRIISPKKNIHLTEEKVRKAMFDILGDSVKGKVVLELFAGSGALGLEAISRGAEKVFFVDKDKKCIDTIRRNIPEEFKEKARVIHSDYRRAIDYLISKREKFDLIILDPPYKKGLVVLTLKKIAENSILLKPETIIVVEHQKGENIVLGCFDLFKQKEYGKTNVSFLKLLNE